MDDHLLPTEEDGEADQHDHAGTGFVTARVRTRLLASVAFASAADLTTALQRMEAHKLPAEQPPVSSLRGEAELDDDDDAPSATSRPGDALNACGWPFHPSWEALGSFLHAADDQVVLLELPAAAEAAAAVSGEQAALVRAAARSVRTPKPRRAPCVQRRQCWQPAMLRHSVGAGIEDSL